MARFTLKDIMIGITFASLGLGMIAFALQTNVPSLSSWDTMQVALTGGGSHVAGQGIVYPLWNAHKRMWEIGMLLGIALSIAAFVLVMKQRAIF